jgi:polar amino acid transport system substrate-binding protein
MLCLFKRFFFFFIIVFSPAFLFSQQGKVLNKILKSGELRVGTSANQPPFTMKAKDGSIIGYEIELARLLTDALNLKLKLIEKPFADLLPALEKGEIDVIMSGMTITAERNVKVSFAGPYIISGKSVLAKNQRLSDLDEMDEINRSNVKLVALKGSTSQSFSEKIIPKGKLLLTKDYDEALKLLIDDKADLMIADYPVCVLSILRNPNADLATLQAPLTIEPIGMAIPANAFQFHNLVANYLNALQIEGILENLEDKWFNDGSWLILIP